MKKLKNYIILGIETSCDDTGISIINASKKADFKVLSNIISSQLEVHKKYGGVYPMMAKREHQKNLIPVFKKALKKAKMLKTRNLQSKIPKFKELDEILNREQELYKKLKKFLEKYKKPDIDLIAVTQGPGLEPCLWTGINFAKALAYYWNIPIVPINHIESHILAIFLENKNIEFPASALIASGGHTQLILMNNIKDYKIIGETRD